LPRKAADALAVQRWVHHRHEQPGSRQQYTRAGLHATGERPRETQQNREAERREHRRPAVAADQEIAEEAPAARSTKKIVSAYAASQPTEPAYACEVGRHPDIDRDLDRDVQHDQRGEAERVGVSVSIVSVCAKLEATGSHPRRGG
jgi:hypothetical protein